MPDDTWQVVAVAGEALGRAIGARNPLAARAAAAAVAAALATVGDGQAGAAPTAAPDLLLTAPEAARRLGVSPHWLYRRAADLPFTVRHGRRLVRFSAAGIARYVERQQAL